jgi:hypothetical protein
MEKAMLFSIQARSWQCVLHNGNLSYRFCIVFNLKFYTYVTGGSFE